MTKTIRIGNKFLPLRAGAPQWLALIFLFLMAGIIGHDPWKQDETYTFGIIYHFYTTHTWLVPVNAAASFVEKPPLYYWTAVLFCKLLSPPLALHDAARLTSVFYMLLTLAFLWKTVQVLFAALPPEERASKGWITLALFLGTFGITRHAHDMFTDVALIAGASIAVYGFALLLSAPDRYLHAGVWLGVGTGIAFLSKGLFLPIIIAITSLSLWIALKGLHNRRTLLSLLVAVLAALPFFMIWPYLLNQESHALFMEWFWENNIGRFLGFSVHRLGADNSRYYFLHALVWFSFPAFPLAFAAAIRGRKNWQLPAYALPVALSLAGILFLMASASGRALYLLPLTLAFAILAAQVFPRLGRKTFLSWNSTWIIICTIAAILMVFTWASLQFPADAQPVPWASRIFGAWLPLGFVPHESQWPYIIFAALIAVLWVFACCLYRGSALNTAYIWLAGMALLWGLGNTLLLPWIDETRSYRPVIEKLNAYLRASPYRNDCIGSYALGESISPMLQYFGDRHEAPPLQDLEGSTCPVLLMDVRGTNSEGIDPRWHLVWKGTRPLDSKKMELRLYARNPIDSLTYKKIPGQN